MGEFPTFVNVRKVELRATQIADPIHRLRYLRHATAAAPLSNPKRGGKLAASLLLVLLAIPLQILSDANVRRTPDLSLPMPPAIRYGSQIPNVWIVDKTKEFEVYSNGLRIENQLAISGQPRWYTLLGRDPSARPGPRRSEPAGIVFHTTESDQAPFEADQNHALIRIGRELLLYVRNKRAYHFLIDRFGRVHRIVMESDAASHAGHSVWADDRWLYMNLNNSFLGVALEGSSQPDKSAVNDAQVHALKVLTEMLRSKYSLPAENCVTHAQVSVNPSNMRIGWHTDWGTGFPFKDIGLPDNYEKSSPVLSLFGFSYDATYERVTNHTIWKGLALAEEEMREAAAVKGIEVAQYRKLLQKRFRDQAVALREQGANEEN
jgi:hypothetical protein